MNHETQEIKAFVLPRDQRSTLNECLKTTKLWVEDNIGPDASDAIKSA
jgi:hypothetical protein